MTEISASLASFFREFEHNSAVGNIPASVAQFADRFLVAAPQGAAFVSAAEFALALPKRHQLFQDLGCKSTTLVSMNPTNLSTRYALVATQWKLTFSRPESDPVDVFLDSTYLIDTGGESPKILVYLAPEDAMSILASYGIRPA